MTGYGPEDLEGYEFKIVRSSMGSFKKPEFLRRALAEEAEAGWQLVEKFDNGRVRLKRRIACREKDGNLPRDPYRSWVGMSENQLGLLIGGIVLGVLLLGGIIAGIAALFG